MLELIQRNDSDNTIVYRKYNQRDYESYSKFCGDNFGRNNYQRHRWYLEWLYDQNINGFLVASVANEIVGIIHNFKAPVLINGQHKIITVLHDWMMDDKHRSGAGLHLIQAGLKSDEYVLLPASIGRLSRAYGRLGSRPFDSFWYKKFQIPKGIFSLNKLLCMAKYQGLAEKNHLIFGHNKEGNEEFRSRALRKYRDIECFRSYFNWRFHNKNSPLSFYVTDESGKSTILFTIGKRRALPYARIFYVESNDESSLIGIIQFVERITSRIGIPVVLYTTFECPPPSHLKYRRYARPPMSYVYSSNRNYEFIPRISSFCSDIGFDGINPFRNILERE